MFLYFPNNMFVIGKLYAHAHCNMCQPHCMKNDIKPKVQNKDIKSNKLASKTNSKTTNTHINKYISLDGVKSNMISRLPFSFISHANKSSRSRILSVIILKQRPFNVVSIHILMEM